MIVVHLFLSLLDFAFFAALAIACVTIPLSLLAWLSDLADRPPPPPPPPRPMTESESEREWLRQCERRARARRARAR